MAELKSINEILFSECSLCQQKNIERINAIKAEAVKFIKSGGNLQDFLNISEADLNK